MRCVGCFMFLDGSRMSRIRVGISSIETRYQTGLGFVMFDAIG